jgi:homoserine kinase
VNPLRVRVPASSANLGPGFDCLGLALALYLEVTLTPAEADALRYRGEGHVADTPDNLIHQGFREVYRHVHKTPPKVRFDAFNAIPLARGLGSSSAALVAGLALADASLGHPLGKDGVFALAAAIEGHPDNIAPAVYGGFTVSAKDETGRFVSRSFVFPETWTLLFGVPDFELPTSRARAVLPGRYSRADAILAASRAALWPVAVMTRDASLLRVASRDVLHEPYREPLITRFKEAKARLEEAGAAACYLSGAGPSLAAVVTEPETLDGCKAALQWFAGEAGRVLKLRSSGGYTYLEVSSPAKPAAP